MSAISPDAYKTAETPLATTIRLELGRLASDFARQHPAFKEDITRYLDPQGEGEGGNATWELGFRRYLCCFKNELRSAVCGSSIVTSIENDYRENKEKFGQLFHGVLLGSISAALATTTVASAAPLLACLAVFIMKIGVNAFCTSIN